MTPEQQGRALRHKLVAIIELLADTDDTNSMIALLWCLLYQFDTRTRATSTHKTTDLADFIYFLIGMLDHGNYQSNLEMVRKLIEGKE
jgi:hypothetical protein